MYQIIKALEVDGEHIKLGAYLPETYQYFPIFTDIFTYNDTAFDTIFFIVAIISRYQNSKEYEISDNEIRL
ncbi:hypothetical protein DW162_07850 [Phocaeicola vulgatus]|nr:hypothetical protein DW162_07850 [Phocaeicola vulgatus]